MRKILFLAAAVLILFSSCEEEVTGVTLDEANQIGRASCRERV